MGHETENQMVTGLQYEESYTDNEGPDEYTPDADDLRVERISGRVVCELQDSIDALQRIADELAQYHKDQA